MATAADLFAANRDSNDELAKLLANRAFAHLKLDDAAAALEDGGAAVLCSPAYEKVVGGDPSRVFPPSLVSEPERHLTRGNGGCVVRGQGHLRVLWSLEALDRPASDLLAAVERGMAACGKGLATRFKTLMLGPPHQLYGSPL